MIPRDPRPDIRCPMRAFAVRVVWALLIAGLVL